jgi:hypothetical protein
LICQEPDEVLLKKEVATSQVSRSSPMRSNVIQVPNPKYRTFWNLADSARTTTACGCTKGLAGNVLPGTGRINANCPRRPDQRSTDQPING